MIGLIAQLVEQVPKSTSKIIYETAILVRLMITPLTLEVLSE